MGMQTEAGDISVYTKPRELNGLKEAVGLSMCQHANPIRLVSTIISIT